MTIKVGNTVPQNMFYGSIVKPVKEVYYGSTKIWPDTGQVLDTGWVYLNHYVQTYYDGTYWWGGATPNYTDPAVDNDMNTTTSSLQPGSGSVSVWKEIESDRDILPSWATEVIDFGVMGRVWQSTLYGSSIQAIGSPGIIRVFTAVNYSSVFTIDPGSTNWSDRDSSQVGTSTYYTDGTQYSSNIGTGQTIRDFWKRPKFRFYSTSAFGHSTPNAGGIFVRVTYKQ